MLIFLPPKGTDWQALKAEVEASLSSLPSQVIRAAADGEARGGYGGDDGALASSAPPPDLLAQACMTCDACTGGPGGRPLPGLSCFTCRPGFPAAPPVLSSPGVAALLLEKKRTNLARSLVEAEIGLQLLLGPDAAERPPGGTMSSSSTEWLDFSMFSIMS